MCFNGADYRFAFGANKNRWLINITKRKIYIFLQIHFSANQKIISPTSVRAPSTPTETQQSVLTSVQQEMAARRKANISRQDSRLSVKCLIESIENATKQAKAGTCTFLHVW